MLGLNAFNNFFLPVETKPKTGREPSVLSAEISLFLWGQACRTLCMLTCPEKITLKAG
jgi:hypothetical protein